MNAAQPTILLDRDGTLNVDHGYVYRPEDLQMIPGVPEALRALQNAGYRLLVVTNQSGVARGYFDEAAIHAFHRAMDACLADHGVRITRYYYCPYHPDHGEPRYRKESEDRKPGIGMFQRADAEFPILRARSYMIGDSLSDLVFGHAAGVQPILVRTGKGAKLAPPPYAWVATDLMDAADRIQHSHSAGVER